MSIYAFTKKHFLMKCQIAWHIKFLLNLPDDIWKQLSQKSYAKNLVGFIIEYLLNLSKCDKSFLGCVVRLELIAPNHFLRLQLYKEQCFYLFSPVRNRYIFVFLIKWKHLKKCKSNYNLMVAFADAVHFHVALHHFMYIIYLHF